jgi:hypothetical protein
MKLHDGERRLRNDDIKDYGMRIEKNGLVSYVRRRSTFLIDFSLDGVFAAGVRVILYLQWQR